MATDSASRTSRTDDTAPTKRASGAARGGGAGTGDGGGRKALRLGLFLAGKQLEEKLLRRPQDVAIGPAEGNTFIVPPLRRMPPKFVLFAAHEDGFQLCLTEDMDGQVFLGGESFTVEELISERGEQRGQVWRVQLDSSARGEVRIGDLKVLFQFVTPPALPPRPQLPLSLRPSLVREVDKRLLQIAVVSFVIHFAFVAYLRAMERPRALDIEELPDRFVKMLVVKKPEPPKPVQPKTVEQKKPEKKPDEQKKPAAQASTEPKAAEPKKDDPEAAARAAQEKQARMAAAMANMGVLKMLTAKGPDGALADALKGGSNDGDPDKVFGQVGGVGPATGQSGLGTARGGDGTGTSKTIGSLVASGPSEGLGTGEKTEKKVRGIVQESAPQDLDSAELDPAAVAAKIKQYRGALVACYEAALKRNASLSGKITLRFTISKLGKVSSVDIEVDTMHDDDFNKCIIDRASSWRFPPPQGGTSDVQFAYPFIFQSAK